MHPSLNDFRVLPETHYNWYQVVLTHPYHGVEVYFFSTEAFQDNVRTWLIPAWVNNFTVICTPVPDSQ